MNYLKKLQLEFVKGAFKNPIKGQVREASQVFTVFKDIKDRTKETLIGVYLNDRLEMNSYSILSVGGESTTLVLPDEIFQNAFSPDHYTLSSCITIRRAMLILLRPTRM